MLTRLLLLCVLSIPAAAWADANDGEFMGFTLGKHYPKTSSNSELTTAGNLLIVAEDPVKPPSIEQVSLVATPESKTIGYIAASSWHDTEEQARASGRRYAEALRTLYPDWGFGREQLDGRFTIVEVNFDKSPYNLQLSLAPDKRDGRDMWRFTMGLGWMANSQPLSEWKALAASERAAARSGDAKSVLNNPEFQGL